MEVIKYSDVLRGMYGQITGSLPRDQVEQALLDYCDSFNRDDVELRRNLFSKDVVFTDPKNSTAFVGLDNLQQMWDQGRQMPGRIEAEVHSTVVCGDTGFLDFSLHFINAGVEHTVLKVREVFEFDASGKIVSVDAYWDENCISQQ